MPVRCARWPTSRIKLDRPRNAPLRPPSLRAGFVSSGAVGTRLMPVELGQDFTKARMPRHFSRLYWTMVLCRTDLCIHARPLSECWWVGGGQETLFEEKRCLNGRIGHAAGHYSYTSARPLERFGSALCEANSGGCIYRRGRRWLLRGGPSHDADKHRRYALSGFAFSEVRSGIRSGFSNP
jgi:hypothetical protein